jgi:hypothetical protein
LGTGRNKVVVTIPRPRKKAVKTEKQLDYQLDFRTASQCATEILKNPEILKAYRAIACKGQTAYNLALRDCLKAQDGKPSEILSHFFKPAEPVSIPAEVNHAETVTSRNDPQKPVTGHTVPQKPVPCPQPRMREILFPVPPDLRVYDRKAAQIGNRSVQWSTLAPGLFKSERVMRDA